MTEEMKGLQVINDAKFNELVEQKVNGIVLFGAPWCHPCKLINPVAAQVAQENEDVDFFYLDVDDNSATPALLGVRGIPTLILLKDGEKADIVVGAVPKRQIEELVKALQKGNKVRQKTA